MMERTVLESGSEAIRTLTLNRPAKLNCINWQMMEELGESLDRLEESSDLRLLFLKGSGERAFSSGGDLKEFRSLDQQETVRWIRLGQKLFSRIESLPALSVAVLDGYVIGGGLELAIACDFRIATPQTMISSPEMLYGWPPGWGALARLPRLIGENHAKQLVFFGEQIQADEALRLGLVNWVAERENSESFCRELSEKISRMDPSLLAFTKAALREGTRVDTDLMATLYARQG